MVSLLQFDDAEAQLTLQMIETLATDVAGKILASWKRLRAIVERHEATLQKRRAKKTRAKKRELLSVVWPHMPDSHQPEVRYWTTLGLPMPLQGDKPGGLWLCINLKDLTDLKSLLVFINARARYHPVVFAPFELDFCMAA